MHTVFKPPKHLRHSSCVALVTITLAALGAGPASAAQLPAQAHAAAPATTVCGTVTGDRWRFLGHGEPSGDAYVVITQNLICKGARFLADVMVNGSPGFKGFKCTRRTHVNGDCKRTIRRGRRRIVQVVGWYPDFGHPNGP